MAESIIISLGGRLGHLGHFSHFDCLLCFNFFNCSGGVGSLGDGFSDGSPDGKSNDNGCEQCGSEGGVIDHDLTPEPSISSSNSTSNQQCFGAMMGLGMKKKSQKNKGRQTAGVCRSMVLIPMFLKGCGKREENSEISGGKTLPS